MTPERQNQLIAALKNKNTVQPCSRCGARHFEVLGETVITLDVLNSSIGGLAALMYPSQSQRSVPAVVVACSNCGYLWQHAVSTLLPESVGVLGQLGALR